MPSDLLNSATISSLLGVTPQPDTVPAMSGIREIDRPIEDRLKYGTSFHSEILSRLNARRLLADRNIASRSDDWRRVDENTQLYIDLSRGVRNADKSTNTKKKEMPWERAIVVPISYAIEQTYLVQLLSIFTRRDPIIEVRGTGPEDIVSAKIMQSVLAYDQEQTQFLVQLYMLFRDAVRYGLGIFYDCWEETYGWKFTRPPPGPMSAFLGLPEVQRSWDMIKQHNMVEALDPRLAWIDPRVSISNGWRAEFQGHRVYCAYLDILEKSQDNGGPYFNVEQVAKLGSGGITRRDTTATRSLKHLQMTGSMDQNDKGFHAKDVMNIRLIPKDWKLGDGERPEMWQFAWVDGSVIIRAHRSQYDHQQLPYAGFETNLDTHVTFNPGVIENLDGIQRFANWQYNSHVQNVMRHLNNSMLYDPVLVEELDILNPTAAGHYRLSAIGSKLLQEGRITMDAVIHQLQKVDVTAGQLGEIRNLYDWGMRMTGASDAMQAQITQDKRTLGEVNQANMGASARMGFYAVIADAMGVLPMAKRWIVNRQQFTDQPQYFQIAGGVMGELARGMPPDQAQMLMQSGRLMVQPEDLAGNFNYVARSGPQPVDPGQMVQSWQILSDTMAKSPVLLTIPDSMGRVPDVQELFKEYARGPLGIRNIDSFYRALPPPTPVPVTVKPDEEVQKERQRGNVVPLRQAGNL